MAIKFKKWLAIALAATLTASGVAYASPEEDTAGGEDSSDEYAVRRSYPYYGDPFGSYSFYGIDAFDGLIMAANADEQPEYLITDYITIEAQAYASSVLNGVTIGIDPGHQLMEDGELEPTSPGSERMKIRQSSGCSGVRSGVPEYRINLLVAEKLQFFLQQCGANVIMSRTNSDISLSNIERAQLMNSAGVSCWIRIHCDSSGDPARRGACVLVPSVEQSAEIYENSLMLGDYLVGSYAECTGISDIALVSLDNQTGFNWSDRPVVALEMGYLSNSVDDARLNRESYQFKCALGLFYGLVGYASYMAEQAADAAALE